MGCPEAQHLCIRGKLIHYNNEFLILPKHKLYIEDNLSIHLHSPTVKTDIEKSSKYDKIVYKSSIFLHKTLSKSKI